MKNKSTKLAKLEKQRYSMLTQDLEYCYICAKEKKKTKKHELHEVFGGRNRKRSMIWGLVVPICRKHHREITDSVVLNRKLQREAKQKFVKKFGKDKFTEEFK